jgi:hypothetical protein
MMINESDNRVSLELKERREIKNSSPKNHEIYRNKLLDEFPLELPLPGEVFYPNSFTGDDEIDYLKGRAIFEGEAWSEVDFDVLYHDYVQFVPLLPQGRIYYLPAFLSYFYDMRHPNSEFRQVLVSGICEGFEILTINEIEERVRRRKTYSVDYSQFEIFRAQCRIAWNLTVLSVPSASQSFDPTSPFF